MNSANRRVADASCSLTRQLEFEDVSYAHGGRKAILRGRVAAHPARVA